MELVELYESAKNVIAPFGQTGRSIAHIHFGMALFVACTLLARRRFAAGWPILLLFLLEVANEAADIAEGWPHVQAWRIRDTASDLVNTMLWPLVLFAVARWQKRRRARDAAATPTHDVAAASSAAAA